MFLYLHPDLCKANVTVGPTKRAKGTTSPTMRVRPTTHKKTQGMQRQVQRAEREYASTSENKPAYKCTGCDAHVKPPRTETISRKLTADEYLDHVGAGREVSHNKHTGVTSVRHPPQIMKEGKVSTLEHGSVTAEMVPGKVGKTNRKRGGLCPGCHSSQSKPKELGRGTGSTPEAAASAAEASVKKSADVLDDLLSAIVG